LLQLDEASSNGSGRCGRKLEEYINQLDPRDLRQEEEARFRPTVHLAVELRELDSLVGRIRLFV
jgi:hypothetical protein